MSWLDPYVMALVGGALIGVSASLLLLKARETAGISGILDGALLGRTDGGSRWRLSFIAGLLLGGFVLMLVSPGAITQSPRSLPILIVAGLLVGFGTRLGGGCTSGHGVCGISRASKPSVLATATFIGAGAATVTILRALGASS